MAPISPYPRVATESKVMNMPDKLSVTEPHTQLCFLHVAVPLLTRQLKPYFEKKKDSMAAAGDSVCSATLNMLFNFNLLGDAKNEPQGLCMLKDHTELDPQPY